MMLPECLQRALAALLAFGACKLDHNDYTAFRHESESK